MRRHLQLAALTFSLISATAVAAEAQDSVRTRARSSEPRTFIYQLGPEDMRIDMRRGRLGITVDLRADAARDSVGARVSGVTPGGPADHAGVQTGDIITRLNGTRLAVAENRGDDDMDRSRPGMRLINLASRLEAGDTVRLDIRRDSRSLTLTFAADRTDMDQLVERMRIPGPDAGVMMAPFRAPFMMGGDAPHGQVHVTVSVGGLGDLELVTVTPQLAEGLGISEGVLVVSIDSSSTLGLRAGDVITAIAGRRPTSPAHAMRILGSYDAGESVAFDVMRQRRRTTVTGRIPEERRGDWRVRPNSFFEHRMPDMPEMQNLPDMQRMREMMRDLPQLRELREMPKMLRIDGKV